MPLSNLLSDLIGDLREPDILWQAVAIVLSAMLGWLLAVSVRRLWSRDTAGGGSALRLGVESFARVLSPLWVVALLYGAKFLLHAQHIHVNALRVAIPLFTSLAAIRLVFYLLHRAFARRGTLNPAFVTFEKVFALLVWAGVALYITGMWPDVYNYLDHIYIPVGKHKPSLFDILQGGISVVILIMLALWAGAALEEKLMRVDGIHTSLRVVLARMSRALLILVAVLLCLPMMGLDLTVLSVFGGAFGVGLGLGMQRIASNYVSGFIILLERSLSIGDMIAVDKFTGKVTQINTRYTVLQGLDGVETVLPNEMLISGPVQNQSLTNRRVRGATRLMLAHGSDLNVVMPLLVEQAVGTPRVLEDPAPGVGLNRFAPEGYEVELGFWIADPENGVGGVVSEVNKKIFRLVQTGEIRLATTALDVRLLDPAPPAPDPAQTVASQPTGARVA